MGETRFCAKCELTKPASEFASKSGAQKHTYCKVCQRSFTRNHYANNKQAYKDRAREAKKAVQAWVDDLKRKPCADCGNTYNPWQMDFDHVTGEKLAHIAVLRQRGASKQLRTELEKCEVVCANCHRQRTHDRLCHRSETDITRPSEG